MSNVEETNKAERLPHLQESGNDRKGDTDTETKELIYPLRKEKEEIKSEIQAEEIEVAETSDESAKPDEIPRLSRWLLNLLRLLRQRLREMLRKLLQKRMKSPWKI